MTEVKQMSLDEWFKARYSQRTVNVLVHGTAAERAQEVASIQEDFREAIGLDKAPDSDSGAE